MKIPTPRNLRRAAERKARKEAAKAEKAAAKATAAQAAEAQSAEAPPKVATASAANNNSVKNNNVNIDANPNVNNDEPDYYANCPSRKPLTDPQLNANRANAQHSTGPTSAEGKFNSSQNRFTHGLVTGTRFQLLANEDPEAFEQFRQGFLEEHNPQTPTETLMVERMVQHSWLIDRARHLQNAAFDDRNGALVDEKKFQLYERYANSHERSFHRCFNTLLSVRKEALRIETGFERKKYDEQVRISNWEVSKLHKKFRESGDWTNYTKEMFDLRDGLLKRFGVVPEN